MIWSCAQVLATNGLNWLLSSHVWSYRSETTVDEGISENFDLCLLVYISPSAYSLSTPEALP